MRTPSSYIFYLPYYMVFMIGHFSWAYRGSTALPIWNAKAHLGSDTHHKAEHARATGDRRWDQGCGTQAVGPRLWDQGGVQWVVKSFCAVPVSMWYSRPANKYKQNQTQTQKKKNDEASPVVRVQMTLCGLRWGVHVAYPACPACPACPVWTPSWHEVSM